ncbi:hypothetical protein CAEBREN_06427 [Caenorhabditis brenneri]|uniref:Serpentine receptor class gamma n=1 Tax=Caenorhabditis brenneri TaxID=135651 RepID=G0P7C4_CAEBE|nr:hypothetical protein CAEBREN_06427 [Caenorhabditis brenneri]
MSKKSKFGNQTYMDYEFKFNTFPVYFALLPMSYVIPTVFIVNYTIFVFMEHYLRRKEFIVNSQIFLVVSMAHIVFSNSPFLLANIAFWMGSTISINIMVIFLVAQARNRGSHHVQYKSRKSRRAELSVTLTTFAMILSFLMRGACLILYLTIPSVASWLAIIRPLGSDAEVVVSPWVFYLTHPAFRRKKRQSTITVGYSISLGSGGARK